MSVGINEGTLKYPPPRPTPPFYPPDKFRSPFIRKLGTISITTSFFPCQSVNRLDWHKAMALNLLCDVFDKPGSSIQGKYVLRLKLHRQFLEFHFYSHSVGVTEKPTLLWHKKPALKLHQKETHISCAFKFWAKPDKYFKLQTKFLPIHAEPHSLFSSYFN